MEDLKEDTSLKRHSVQHLNFLPVLTPSFGTKGDKDGLRLVVEKLGERLFFPWKDE